MAIMVAIDMHVKNLVCEMGYGKRKPKRRTFTNDLEGHESLLYEIEMMKEEHGTEDVLVAYEASGLGYVLFDRVREAGHRCAVLAPTELLRSATGYKKKTDKKDASYIYETVRGHVLAGNRLGGIWVPSKQLRDDREVVRVRFDAGRKVTCAKGQIHTLLKKYGIQKPEELSNWTIAFRGWLKWLMEKGERGFGVAMGTLLRQLEFLEKEAYRLTRAMVALAGEERYRDQYSALIRIAGVGPITAMTFLTEIGDVERFSNRRQVGSFMGLVPSSFESGESEDRKGRITRDGPYRLRSVLNQSFWAHLKYNGEEREAYYRIVERNPKHKKKAVVACMRRLGIRMWRTARDVVTSKKMRFVA
jgi:transposase